MSHFFPTSARHAKPQEFLELRHDFDLPRVVYECEDVFPDELSGLPNLKFFLSSRKEKKEVACSLAMEEKS